MQTKRYFEIELGRVTTGYEPVEQKTLVRRWCIAACGPAELSSPGLADEALQVIEQILRSSAEQAGYEAFLAAYAVPGDLSARLATAWQVFWQRFPVLVQTRGEKAAEAFLGSFDIGLVEDTIWLDGLVLQASAGEATARLYAEAGDLIARQFSGDVGKAVGEYFALVNRYRELMSVDIDVQVPREVSQVIADAAKLAKAMEDVPQRLVDLGNRIEEEAAKLGHAIEKEVAFAALRAGKITQGVADQLNRAGIRVELNPESLKSLLEGPPRLDFKTADELQQRLVQEGGKIIQEIGQKAAAEARAVLDKLNALKSQLERAIHEGARQVVDDLKREFERVSKDFTVAKTRLDGLATQLLDGGLPDLSNVLKVESLNLGSQLGGLQTFVANAPAAVEARVRELAEQAARELAAAAQRLLDEAAKAVRRVFGF